MAHLPYVKTFEQFDVTFQLPIVEWHIRELRTLRFIHDVADVILCFDCPVCG